MTADRRLRIWNGGRLEADVPNEALTTRPPSTTGPGWSRRTPPRGEDVAHPAASRGPRTVPCSALLASPTRRQQALDLPPVRQHGPHQHDGRPGLGRGGGAGQGHAQGPGHERPTATAATAGSIPSRERASPWPRPAGTWRRRGRVPIGATNCLNFGNPERPEVMGQLVRAIAGIGEACRALDVPITGGNVSLYNETDGQAIYPTPVLGVVGLLEDANRALTSWFKEEGDAVYLLGRHARRPGRERAAARSCTAGSRGAPRASTSRWRSGSTSSWPEAAAAGVAPLRPRLRDGGLAVALAECCFRGRRAGPRRPLRPAGGRSAPTSCSSPSRLPA